MHLVEGKFEGNADVNFRKSDNLQKGWFPSVEISQGEIEVEETLSSLERSFCERIIRILQAPFFFSPPLQRRLCFRYDTLSTEVNVPRPVEFRGCTISRNNSTSSSR